MNKLFVLLLIFLLSISLFSSTTQNKIKIFIDYLPCDFDYIRTEINFVDYVTSYEKADIHIIFYHENMANAGEKYSVEFIGQHKFKELNQKINFIKNPNDTEEILRKKIKKVLLLGISYFISQLPDFENIQISYTDKNTNTNKINKRKTGWIYSIYLNYFSSGSDKRSEMSGWINLSAKKITKYKKLIFGTNTFYSKSKTKLSDYTYTNSSTSKISYASLIQAINNHFSWAIFLTLKNKKYENIYFSGSVAPALEYNVFPYNESSKHQLRLQFFVKPLYNKYYHETIYGKNNEFLLKNELAIAYDIITKWGSNTTKLSASHYVHNTALNNFGLYNQISINIFSGVKVNINLHVERTHDQIYISSEGLSNEEIISNKTAQQTNYSYFTSIGLSYSFGSIYNNIVNPRFGN